jgi:hypothetical protein
VDIYIILYVKTAQDSPRKSTPAEFEIVLASSGWFREWPAGDKELWTFEIIFLLTIAVLG